MLINNHFYVTKLLVNVILLIDNKKNIIVKTSIFYGMKAKESFKFL